MTVKEMIKALMELEAMDYGEQEVLGRDNDGDDCDYIGFKIEHYNDNSTVIYLD